MLLLASQELGEICTHPRLWVGREGVTLMSSKSSLALNLLSVPPPISSQVHPLLLVEGNRTGNGSDQDSVVSVPRPPKHTRHIRA